MGVGWLNYVKAVAVDVGVSVIDRDVYLVFPDINCTVRLSRRTLRPVFRFCDSNYFADILCYYSPRIRRYVCRALPLMRRIGKYEWQSVFRLVFEACYRPYAEKVTDNLHVECHKVYLFASRDVNRYIRRYCRRRLRSLRCVLEFFNEIYVQLRECCEVECVSENFPNYDYLIENADTEFDYYSLDRYSDVCYMDRCIDRLPDYLREKYREKYASGFPFVCTVDVEAGVRRFYRKYRRRIAI